MRLETDDPEVFEQWMRFAKAQMPFPLFGKDWLVQRYSAAPRNVPGVRFRCELQEVKRVPAALKVGSRVRVVNADHLARYGVTPGYEGKIVDIGEAVAKLDGAREPAYTVEFAHGIRWNFLRGHIRPTTTEENAEWLQQHLCAVMAQCLAANPSSPADALQAAAAKWIDENCPPNLGLDSVSIYGGLDRSVTVTLPRPSREIVVNIEIPSSETDESYRERLANRAAADGSPLSGCRATMALYSGYKLDTIGNHFGLPRVNEEIAPLGFGDADLAKATDDAVMRPLPPPKPPVAELSGPVKHGAAAMPAKALKR